MGDPPERDSRLGGGLRRVVDDAFDATVGGVGHSVAGAAVDVTGATAEQVIEGLEPYLVEQAIPKIVEGIQPYLTETVVPGMLEDLTPRLVDDALPRILDDLRPYLEAELIPAVVDSLMPHLKESVAPDLIDALMPKIEGEIAPQIVDAMMPKIEGELAPQIVDAMMPKIEREIAPQIVDAMMPKIEGEIAPQIIDAVMPKIRNEIVPTILDDIVDDPAVRDLIREQSQGLILDSLEAFRGTLAKADSIVDSVGRHILRRPDRPQTPTALDIVMADASEEASRPMRVAVEDLAAKRAMWREQPAPPAPPGRNFAYAGAVTRLLAFAIDSFLVAWVAGQGLAILLNLLESLFGTLPSWVVGGLTLIAASLTPFYLAVSYWTAGRSLGMAITGVRVCTPDGRRLTFLRSVVRAWALLLGFVFWVATGLITILGPRRRLVLDMLLHTEVRYEVPEAQQRRHIRDALTEMRDGQHATGGGAAD